MSRQGQTSAARSVEINAGCVPDPRNPHTWLPLIGDPPETTGTRILYGCLRPVFRGHANSAAAFSLAKITVAAPADTPPWTLTAARAEVLLPAGADDRFSDPQTLMETVDAELPQDAKALLAYLTFTCPADRLHAQWELVREFVRRCLVDPFGVAALLVQHAPHKAASANLPHVHVLLPGPRRLGSLGFAEWVKPLASDKAHRLVGDAFIAFQANWPSNDEAPGACRLTLT
jgi:hypothetical protein